MDEPNDSELPDEDNELADDESTAFPASELTPGQPESRAAYALFREWVGAIHTEDSKVTELPKVLLDHRPGSAILDEPPAWLPDYDALRAEGWKWRQAAFIAWAASPTTNRWPANQVELAKCVLGLRSDRTIRKWREKDPRIDERIGKLQVEPLFAHRRDVIDALIAVAKDHDPKAHPDRRMFLEMTGDYKPKGQIALTNPDGGPVQLEDVTDYSDLDDEQLDRAIDNLEAAS